MDKFGLNLVNKILEIFFNNTNSLDFCSSPNKLQTNPYIKESIFNRGVQLLIFLCPKRDLYEKIDVLKLEIFHFIKKESDHINKFRDFETIVNDQEQHLNNGLKYFYKLFITACFTSPFVDFLNSTNPEIISLQKKFSIDYSFEYSSSYEISFKDQTINDDCKGKVFFSKKIENSMAILSGSMTLMNNLENVLSKIKLMDKYMFQKAPIGQKVKRTRFFSEDTDNLESDEKTFRYGALSSRKSEFQIKNFEENSSISNQIGDRPFKFLDELISDAMVEQLSNEDDNLQNSEDKVKKKFYSASLFTDDQSSPKSKMNGDQMFKGKDFQEENPFEDFEVSGTIENLYYMTRKINKFLNIHSQTFIDDKSFSSKSYYIGNAFNRKDSSNTFNRRNFLRFYN